MRHLTFAAIGVLSLSVIAPESAAAGEGKPSFDCLKASTKVEEIICDDPELANLDMELEKAFRHAMQAPGADPRRVKAEQRQWLKDRAVIVASASGTGDEELALRTMYRARIKALRHPRELDRDSAAPQMGKVCDTLAELVRGGDGFVQDKKDHLLSRGLTWSRGPLRLGVESGEILSDDEAKRLPLSDDLRERLARLVPRVWRLATDPAMVVIETTSGTMYCQRLEWFLTSPDGTAKAIEPPEPNSDDNAYCWSEAGYVGAMNGMPVLAVENHRIDHSVLRLFQYQAGAWSNSCTLTAHYRRTPEIAEAFCAGDTCAMLRSAVAPWVSAIDASPKDASAAPPAGLDVTEFEGDPDKGPMATLPTLGEHSQTSYVAFSSDAPIFHFEAEGGPYLVRISKGNWGWHVSDDYLVGIYRRGPQGVEGVAGYVVTLKRVGLDRVETELPSAGGEGVPPGRH